ncbi:MAG: DUF7948 domain-containing protein [Candidatus Heimdallarchaeota archaeon]
MVRKKKGNKRTIICTVAMFLILFSLTPIINSIANNFENGSMGVITNLNSEQSAVVKENLNDHPLIESIIPDQEKTINYDRAMNAISNFFIENSGQLSEEYQYYAKINSGYVYFGESKIIFFVDGKEFSIQFQDAKLTQPIGKSQLQSKSIFYLGTQAVQNARHYREIVYDGLYEGISVVYRFTNLGLKYDIIVEPFADINDIQMNYQGFESLQLDEKKLELTIGDLTIVDHKLVAWYDIVNEPLAVEFNQITSRQSSSTNDYTINFQITERYDNTKRIIIDPLICGFSTFIGGSADELFGSAADVGEADLTVDKSDNIILCGRTTSTNFPVVEANQSTHGGGSRDAFVIKLSPDGQTLIFATFLGGSGEDWATDVDTDENNNIAIVGTTSSMNFPIKDAIQDTNHGGTTFDIDQFVVKLNSTGHIQFSTYWGGTEGDWGYGVAFDTDNRILVTGDTYSTDYPTKAAEQDEHSSAGANVELTVTKFSATGQSITFSTYLGGSSNDWGYGIVADSDNNIIVTGGLMGSDYPFHNAYQTTCLGGSAIIVIKFEPDGTLVFATSLDGSGEDSGYEVDVDSDDNIVICGHTSSSNYPVENATQGSNAGSMDVAITKLSADGQTLLYSTYFGGSGSDKPYALVLDEEDNIIVTGETTSTNLPIKHSYQHTFQGTADAFITVIAKNGTVIASTYLGGSSLDYGQGIAVNSDGDIIIGGFTKSANYPTENPYQDTLGGSSDMFVSTFSLNLSLPDYTPPPTETPTPSPTETGGITMITICGLLALIGGSISMANRRKQK